MPSSMSFIAASTPIRKCIGGDGDLMVIDPNSAFFKYLKDGEGS